MDKIEKNNQTKSGTSDKDERAYVGAKASASTNEIGYSGINITAGQIEWEYQTKLRDFSDRVEVYKKMRSDGTVDNALTSIELPFLSQSAWIEPASEDKEDLFYANFIADQLIRDTNSSTTYSHQDHLAEEAGMYQYGCSIFEIVFEKGDYWDDQGKVHPDMYLLKKLAHRDQSSIDRWVFDFSKDNGLDGIIQKPPSGDISAKYKNSKDIFIEIEKLLIYVNNKKGDNWEGISILRPVYKHLTYKDGLYKIDAIGLQKNAMGIPALYLQNPSPARIEEAKKFVRSVMVNEEAGFILNKDREDLKVYEAGINSVAIHRSISHHDSKIMNTVFAGFLLLGLEGRGGSRSLGSSLIEFFMMNIDSKINYSSSIKNRYLIPKMINSNFTNVRRYPKYRAYSSRVTDKKTMAEILSILTTNSFVDPMNTRVREYVNGTFGLPNSDQIMRRSESPESKNIGRVNVKGEGTSTPKEKPSETIRRKISGGYGIDPKDEKRKELNSRWENIVDNLVYLQKEELSKKASLMLKNGEIPNINNFETPYMSELENMIDYMCSRYEGKAIFDKSYDVKSMVASAHDLQMRGEVIGGIFEVAREQGTLV